MASNRSATEAPFVPTQRDGESQTFGYGSYNSDNEGPWQEWNPSEDTLRPVRGRHRVAKKSGVLARNGLARSSTVLGVGVIAAVSGAGMASAQSGKAPVSISMPDMPNVGSVFEDEADEPEPEVSKTPLSSAGLTAAETEQGTADAGEALRARIMAQAESQQDAFDKAAAEAAQTAAADKAAEQAAQEKKEAEAKEAAAKKKAEEEAAEKKEAERLAALAKQFALPTSSYTLTSTFGQAGPYWSSGYHTGLDFAAPTGTLIKAVHSGTITQAGYEGSYGYKTVLTLDDGTEIWYAHQSSIGVSVGQKVATGDVIGRVGATGNVTGAHLHMEVHPGGSSSGIDPAAWLRSKGLTP
ncbi:M23 family metallopeptidase [Streptomyces sp. DSM 3412]|uniref:M23 family metallopeptidase n=1 Tax=Streptomyces gottesmaniae TaxID=3075518 RepID=A0ABU2Z1Z4_9ACTN|nr:M23 family metallopeptidase [Streptomyces sp. DSM 3412]MDT0570608.1 M23 family metallopeptidase [Streptomyces sp. DSM 3412]